MQLSVANVSNVFRLSPKSPLENGEYFCVYPIKTGRQPNTLIDSFSRMVDIFSYPVLLRPTSYNNIQYLLIKIVVFLLRASQVFYSIAQNVM